MLDAKFEREEGRRMANWITLTADPIKVKLRKAKKNLLLNITGRVKQFAK